MPGAVMNFQTGLVVRLPALSLTLTYHWYAAYDCNPVQRQLVMLPGTTFENVAKGTKGALLEPPPAVAIL